MLAVKCQVYNIQFQTSWMMFFVRLFKCTFLFYYVYSIVYEQYCHHDMYSEYEIYDPY